MLKKILGIVSLVTGFWLLVTSASAQESLTITTFYPSPYGSYREMRVQRMAIGDSYYDGAQYCWPDETCTTTITTNADLVVEGSVGIGTTSPPLTLTVGQNTAGNNTDYGIAVLRHGTLASPGTYTVNTPALFITDISGDGPTSAETQGLVDIRAQRIADSDTYAANALLFNVNNDTGSALAVKGNRNVGIGTTSPNVPLEIYNTYSQLALTSSSTSNYARVMYSNGSFLNAGNSFIAGIHSGGIFKFISQPTSGAWTDVISMTQSGNVSIAGTLTVNGNQTGAADYVFDDYDDIELLRKWRKGESLPFETGDILNRDRLLRDAIIQLTKRVHELEKLVIQLTSQK